VVGQSRDDASTVVQAESRHPGSQRRIIGRDFMYAAANKFLLGQWSSRLEKKPRSEKKAVRERPLSRLRLNRMVITVRNPYKRFEEQPTLIWLKMLLNQSIGCLIGANRPTRTVQGFFIQ
jgi:hypothetical protein